MKIQIIEGTLTKKARSKAYKYLKELYRKEKLKPNEGNLREGIDRGAGTQRVQSEGATESLSGESKND